MSMWEPRSPLARSLSWFQGLKVLHLKVGPEPVKEYGALLVWPHCAQLGWVGPWPEK